ncbi:hypothetical protein SLA2020_013000 [Shorea laevis]
MATNIQTAAFLVFLAATVLQTTHAAVYTVGNSTGWQTPTSNPNFYSTWASQYTFKVGDSLVFNFATGAHDVATSSQADYSSCNIANALSVDRTGPVTIVLNATGTQYYFCTFSNHCSQGQKVAVSVVSGTPGPSGSPGSVSPPPPPHSSGASSLMVTFSVIFMSLAIYLLMW